MHGGNEPAINCDGDTLNQVYYYFDVKGNAVDGKYLPVDSCEFSAWPWVK